MNLQQKYVRQLLDDLRQNLPELLDRWMTIETWSSICNVYFDFDKNVTLDTATLVKGVNSMLDAIENGIHHHRQTVRFGNHVTRFHCMYISSLKSREPPQPPCWEQ